MIQLRSVYDLKAYQSFQKYSWKKIYVLTYICSLILILLGILFAFCEKKIYVVYLLLGVLFPVMMHVLPKTMWKIYLNKNIYLRSKTVQIFTFDEEGFELEQVSNIDIFKERYNYSNLLSVIKYKEYYFMYINRSQAFIVCANDFVQGNEAELDELLKTNKKEKFIVKKQIKHKVSG